MDTLYREKILKLKGPLADYIPYLYLRLLLMSGIIIMSFNLIL